MGADLELVAAVGPAGRAQHQVECVLGVDGQAADLGREHVHGPRDGAGFAAVAVEREGFQGRGREDDRVPFQDEGGLGRIATDAEFGCFGRGEAVFLEDCFLEGGEGRVRLFFRGVVLGDSDVDDRAGGYAGWEEDGGEFNL